MQNDERSEPQYGERVPFVVVHRGPSHRLVDAVVAPEELLYNSSLRLHATYYITKQIIPPLSRVFNLLGADISYWYQIMPKQFLVSGFNPESNEPGYKKQRIDEYFRSNHCIICNAISEKDMCSACLQNIPMSLLNLATRISKIQGRFKQVQEICRSCSSHSTFFDTNIDCISLDCSIFYRRVEYNQKIVQLSKLIQTSERLENAENERRWNF
jgi:hypothetical protein